MAAKSDVIVSTVDAIVSTANWAESMRKMEIWCLENIGRDNYYRQFEYWHFDSEYDALFFLLRWGGVLEKD